MGLYFRAKPEPTTTLQTPLLSSGYRLLGTHHVLQRLRKWGGGQFTPKDSYRLAYLSKSCSTNHLNIQIRGYTRFGLLEGTEKKRTKQPLVSPEKATALTWDTPSDTELSSLSTIVRFGTRSDLKNLQGQEKSRGLPCISLICVP